MKNLKIINCASFSESRNAEAFYGIDRKVSHGLIRNNHMVYDFSFRENAKKNRLFGIKKTGIRKMNKNLIQTCFNLKPDVLLLGNKVESVSIETIKDIRAILPNIKIGQWFVDLFSREEWLLKARMPYLDCFFATAASELKNHSMKYKDTTFAFIPNMADPSFQNVKSNNKEYDVIYIARDDNQTDRVTFQQQLKIFCAKEKINLKIFGPKGFPKIFGNDYLEVVANAKIAIVFNRDDFINTINDKKILGTSDKLSHFMGCGTCVFSPKINDLDLLYEDNQDIIYFDNFDDCGQKIKNALHTKSYLKIGEQGQKKAFEISNPQRITKYFLEVLYGVPLSENYQWQDYVFRNKKKLY